MCHHRLDRPRALPSLKKHMRPRRGLRRAELSLKIRGIPTPSGAESWVNGEGGGAGMVKGSEGAAALEGRA